MTDQVTDSDVDRASGSAFDLIRAACPRDITRGEFDRVLVDAIADVCSTAPEAVRPDMTFDEMGFESIAMTAALAEVEERFEVEIPEEVLLRLADAVDIETVGDLMKVLTE